MALKNEQQRQYQCLCIVLRAIKNSRMHISNIAYRSGSSFSDTNFAEFEKAACKLAQAIDSQKGDYDATALAITKGLRGPEYAIASTL
ncbi:hypothetical protein FSPOR_10017 [Fusarium sporotrichioides]|uniref:Uncharacterized protein n=1 Tax=Fusarium sporotrichioides TaxID=5514 RepID=A0A395RMN9_FUSSP|nr:hypothetical protein FSPOR_10017 [Fusarium sporotrichioides]